jgi:hypothetical protein
MRFVIDAMLPPSTCDLLTERGHDAVTPAILGAHNLPDQEIVELAAAQGRVIVIENARDFAHVTACPVVFVRKSWWPMETLAVDLAASLDRWAADNPDPADWPHWLTEVHRS